jgi:hypothetical protein
MKHNTINEPFQRSLKLTYSIYKDSVASLQRKQCTPVQGHSQAGAGEWCECSRVQTAAK